MTPLPVFAQTVETGRGSWGFEFEKRKVLVAMATMRFPLELWDGDADRAAVLVKGLEASDGPVAVVDAIGNVVFVNPAAEALWGEPAEALINRAIVSLTGLDGTRAAADAFGDRLERGEAWEGRISVCRAGPRGEVRRLRRVCRMEPVRAVGGKRGPRVLGAVVAIRTLGKKA